MHRLIRGALLLAILLQPALAGADPATDRVRETTQLLKTELAGAGTPEEALLAVTSVLASRLDAPVASRLVLGPVWARADDTNRAAFAAAFSALLLRTYATAIVRGGVPEVTYLEPRGLEHERRRLVRTRAVLADGRDIAVNYRLRRTRGEWKIHDVVIEGVSLVATFRAELRPLARRDGIRAATRALERRNAR